MSLKRSLYWASAADLVTVFAVAQGKLKQLGAVCSILEKSRLASEEVG